MNIRHADELRNYIRDNLLTEYYPAVAWLEDTKPFTITDRSIIYCRQEGQAVDAFVRQISVDVYLFGPAGGDGGDMNQIYTDAVAAMEYIQENFRLSDDIRLTISGDVTGEFYTGQNRQYYRFTVFCYTN